MNDKNPFKDIESRDVEPGSHVKELVMKRIGFKEVLMDVFGLFTVNVGRSVTDLINQKNENNPDKKSPNPYDDGHEKT